ncbi:MAG TPA: recombinase RecA [Thermoprotei archaeon]|nr:recombinase RecA [Thermoprotei archaeon]
MVNKKCYDCPFYSPQTSYCLKLFTFVKNPDEPPCITVKKTSDSFSYKKSFEMMSEPISPPIEDLSYVPTGIPGLDELLHGGFLRGKTYLIAGETGAGKTIFSLQFLIYGALNNEPGIYLAIDEPTEHLLKGMKRFGWDVYDLIREGRLRFLDMRTHFSKIYLKDERGKIEPRFVIDIILKNIRRINARRLVIDPIAPLMYGNPENVLYAREFLREMVFSLERLGNVTTIMTSEIPTGSNQYSRFGVEEFLASGIIILKLKEIKGRIYRVLYIRKARWAPVRPGKYVFRIESGKGIIIKGPLEKFL